MKISFVIPVYNAAAYLNKCVESIFESKISEEKYEIILVDDGSTDNSIQVAKAISQDHKNVSLFIQKNQGSSVARNNGIEKAQGDYIWFIDSDDYLDTELLIPILNCIETNQVDIFAIQLKIIDGNKTRLECIQSGVVHNSILTGRDAVLSGYLPSSACALICRTDWLKANDLRFYPGISHQDVEFSMRAMALANNVYFSNFTPYIYIKHSGSVSMAKNADKLYFYMIGDMYVALSYKKFAETLLDKELKKHIVKWSNSIILNLLFSLKRKNNPMMDTVFVKKMLDDLNHHDVFPVKGPYKTLRQYLYAFYINAYLKSKYATY